MALGAHFLSPAEHKAMLDAERRGETFLAFRDGLGDLRLLVLEGRDRLAVGRMVGNDLVLDWDPKVSRSHAQLERVGSDWTVVDDGLSRNGTQVNGERIHVRTRLHDGDVVRLGRTTMVFRAPVERPASTLVETGRPTPRLTEAERRVLVALCAPYLADRGPAPAPASNREIAEALSLSLDGVKSQVRALFLKLEIGDLPQGRKRVELARRALEDGLVTRADG